MFHFSSFGLGFIAGFGTGFLSREIVELAKEKLKPVAKEAMRVSLDAIEKGKEFVAHAGEAIEDLLAEIKSESKAAVQEKDAKTAKSRKKTSAAKS